VGRAPLQVLFDDRSSAGAVQWSWDFGDGSVSSAKNPAHVYVDPGAYTVTLTVSGPGGTAACVEQGLVQVQIPAQASQRNGSGQNRVCFQSTSLPVLGAPWTAEIDASQHPGAGATLIVGAKQPYSGLYFPAGEALVLATGGTLFRSYSFSGGAVAHHTVPIPAKPGLAGRAVYTQGLIVGGGLELSNAVDLVLGY